MRAAAFCLLRVNTNSIVTALIPNNPTVLLVLQNKKKKKKIYLAAINVTVPHTGTMCSNYMHTQICKYMHLRLRNIVKGTLDANLLLHKTFLHH